MPRWAKIVAKVKSDTKTNESILTLLLGEHVHGHEVDRNAEERLCFLSGTVDSAYVTLFHFPIEIAILSCTFYQDEEILPLHWAEWKSEI